MKPQFFLALLAVFGLIQPAPTLCAQEVDGSELQKELNERNQRVSQLSLEEQLKLRAAQLKAGEDPEVQLAMRRRNEAVDAFRAAVRASMLRSDSTIKSILEKIAPNTASRPGESAAPKQER